ncbi:GPP34 family phosphoprotein [Dactylosporangium sp. NPDC000521]|uniref:GOLPH3/VPS74 family protein n=1 Tax=Dactylosporangium sp. NPDC000521 TaxID=3363975 RepID=UPI0036A0F7FE
MVAHRPLHAEYFLLAHDGYSGRLHIDPHLADAGVAAAILADLSITGHIAIDGGVVQVRSQITPPTDAIAAAVVEQVGQGRHDVARWVWLLAGVATTLVSDHLVHDGVVARPPARLLDRLTLAGPRHIAMDAVAAAAPRVLLRHAAAGDGPADPRIAALAALAVATGLEHVIADGANRTVRGRLRELADTVDGDLRRIVEGMDTAAIRITLTPNRGQ